MEGSELKKPEFSESMLRNLKQELALLDKNQRLAIHYRFWEEMSIEEIAEMLKLSWEEAYELIGNTINHLRKNLSGNLEEILKQTVA